MTMKNHTHSQQSPVMKVALSREAMRVRYPLADFGGRK